MGFENVWQVIGIVCGIVGAPLMWSSFLTSNPYSLLSKVDGWVDAYNKSLNSPNGKRSFPFRTPLWVHVLFYVAAAGCLVVPTYVLQHNGGNNKGIDNPTFTFPLFFLWFTVFASTIWVPFYVSKSEYCFNFISVQIGAIGLNIVTLILFIENLDIGYALLSIPYLIWNVYVLVKCHIEHVYTGCPGSARMESAISRSIV
jgi:hypothetical protein